MLKCGGHFGELLEADARLLDEQSAEEEESVARPTELLLLHLDVLRARVPAAERRFLLLCATSATVSARGRNEWANGTLASSFVLIVEYDDNNSLLTS